MDISDVEVGSTWLIYPRMYDTDEHRHRNRMFVVREITDGYIRFTQLDQTYSWNWTYEDFFRRCVKCTTEGILMVRFAVLTKLLSDEKSLSSVQEALVRLEI